MGPTLGGWLTDSYSWHWVFLINLPIGAITVIGLMVFMDDTKAVAIRRFDWLGFLSLAIGIGALQIMLDRGEIAGWFSSSEIVTELIIAIAGFYFFFTHSFTTDNPFVRFAIFRDRNFVSGLVFMAFIGVVLFGTMSLTSPFMQNVLGYPITTAGWLLGSRGVGTLVSMLLIGRLLRFVEARWLILTGLALLAGTLYQMENFTDQTTSHTIVAVSIVQGFGIGLVFVPLTTIAFLSIAPELRTDGTAMLTLIRNIFSSIGISGVIAELTNTATVMHARLVENVTPFNNALQMPDVASTLNLATDTGKALLDQIVTQQATIIAYANDFKLLMLLAIVAMPLVLLMGSSRSVQGPQEAAAHAMG